MKIAAIPKGDRPREKAKEHGISSLSDAELIALLLGNGVSGASALEISYSLLQNHGGLPSLSRAPYAFLLNQKGLSEARCLALLAAFEIGRRANASGGKYTAERAYAYLKAQNLFCDHEQLLLFFLSRRGKILGQRLLSIGKEGEVDASPRRILSAVLASSSPSFALAHTHPSGSFLPSKEDLEAFASLKEQSRGVGVTLKDFLIASEEGYYSLEERNRSLAFL